MPGRSRDWWRSLALVVILEPAALALLYVALSGGSSWSSAASSEGVPSLASFSTPRQAQPPAVVDGAEIAAVKTSRVTRERGQYVVDLHAAPVESAVEMLSTATRTRVSGSGIFGDSALRLTRSVVAATPREAWQAVFGDVANFAITCAGGACEVRFVSLATPGSPVAAWPVTDPGQPVLARELDAAAAAPQATVPVAAVPRARVESSEEPQAEN